MVFLRCGWTIIAPIPASSIPEGPRGFETVLSLGDCLQSDLPRPEFEPFFGSADSARAAANAAGYRDAFVVEVALEADCIEFLRADSASPHWPANVDSTATVRDADVLGFDVLGFDGACTLVHSWLCFGYGASARIAAIERGPEQDSEVWLNALGLIESERAAQALLHAFANAAPADRPAEVPWCVALVLAPAARTDVDPVP